MAAEGGKENGLSLPRTLAQEVAGPEQGARACALLEGGARCKRPAGNASYSQRVQRTAAQRKLDLTIDPAARHIYICDHHKDHIQTARVRKKRSRAQSEEDSWETEADGEPVGEQDVDLFQLQMNTLRRYKKHYKVTSRPGLNKALLADSLTRHFRTLPVVEKEALTFFIYMIKTNKSKLDGERPEKPVDTE